MFCEKIRSSILLPMLYFLVSFPLRIHGWGVSTLIPFQMNNCPRKTSKRNLVINPTAATTTTIYHQTIIGNSSTKAPLTHQTVLFSTNDNTVGDDDDYGARSQFGTKEYWDELYAGRGEFPADEYSWYFGWGEYQKFVRDYIPNKKDSKILLPGIGNDPIVLDLLQNGYKHLTATDYSQHAIDRQEDLLSYSSEYNNIKKNNDSSSSVELLCMDARRMDTTWTNKFDAVLEKGALDAIYLSGDGNLELAVSELERVVKPGGVIISVSGVVPEELRRLVFKDWEWLRDGSDDLKAGCFVLMKRNDKS